MTEGVFATEGHCQELEKQPFSRGSGAGSLRMPSRSRALERGVCVCVGVLGLDPSSALISILVCKTGIGDPGAQRAGATLVALSPKSWDETKGNSVLRKRGPGVEPLVQLSRPGLLQPSHRDCRAG